jgi:hypothetical protein
MTMRKWAIHVLIERMDNGHKDNMILVASTDKY